MYYISPLLGSINIFTQNCDLKFSFREYIEDDGISN